MKSLKVSLIIIAAMALVLGLSGMSFAFHGGGVAHCDGCHSMHNSADNPIGIDHDGNPTGASANGLLLKGSDASSTCLNCHGRNGGYGVFSNDGSNKNTGGDFFFLTIGYSKTVHGSTHEYLGRNAGHNIIADDYGLVEDISNTQAPGGTYPSNDLGCTSCHDAHGQVLDGTAGGQDPIASSGSYASCDSIPAGTICGNYRLLGDSLYEAGNETSDNYGFTYNAPVARSDGSGGAVVRYGSGMSAWCSNCHADFGVNNDGTKHPTNQILNGYGDNYNQYVATGDFTGDSTTSWDPLVPFETGTTDASTLLATAINTIGPDGGARVMCLTCHRAHASGHNNSGRWDLGTEYIADSASLEDQGVQVPASAVIYYGDGSEIDVVAKYGEFQRNLCNKCHVQD
jgi:hypothetical protein